MFRGRNNVFYFLLSKINVLRKCVLIFFRIFVVWIYIYYGDNINIREGRNERIFFGGKGEDRGGVFYVEYSFKY